MDRRKHVKKIQIINLKSSGNVTASFRINDSEITTFQNLKIYQGNPLLEVFKI